MRTSVTETCRYWVTDDEDEGPRRCGAPAVAIFWGRYEKDEHKGPMCLDHSPVSVFDRHAFGQHAAFDLRGLSRGRA